MEAEDSEQWTDETKILGTTCRRGADNAAADARAAAGARATRGRRVLLRGWAGTARQRLQAQASALSPAHVYGIASTGATERTIKQYMVHWRRTTVTTLRIFWKNGREKWDDYAVRRAATTQQVADRWGLANWGEQPARQSATWLGHVSRGAGWPQRLLD